MKNTRSIEIKVGIVSIVGIALLIIGVAIGKGFNVNTGQPEIKFLFPSSGGVETGAPVVVNGVDRGKVTSVENNEGNVIIKARIDNHDDFHTDVSAMITILEITGGKKIQIKPGTEGDFDPNTFIQGKTPPDIADLVVILGEVSSDAVSLIRNLDTALIAANELLADEKFISELKSTVTNINSATGKLDTFLDDNYYKLQNTIDDLAVISSELKGSVIRNEPKVSKLIDELDKTLISANDLINNTNFAVNDLKSVADDIKDITSSVKNGDGFVNKIIYDKEFSSTLDSTIIKLNELVNIIHEHGVNVNVRLGTRP